MRRRLLLNARVGHRHISALLHSEIAKAQVRQRLTGDSAEPCSEYQSMLQEIVDTLAATIDALEVLIVPRASLRAGSAFDKTTYQKELDLLTEIVALQEEMEMSAANGALTLAGIYNTIDKTKYDVTLSKKRKSFRTAKTQILQNLNRGHATTRSKCEKPSRPTRRTRQSKVTQVGESELSSCHKRMTRCQRLNPSPLSVSCGSVCPNQTNRKTLDQKRSLELDQTMSMRTAPARGAEMTTTTSMQTLNLIQRLMRVSLLAQKTLRRRVRAMRAMSKISKTPQTSGM